VWLGVADGEWYQFPITAIREIKVLRRMTERRDASGKVVCNNIVQLLDVACHSGTTKTFVWRSSIAGVVLLWQSCTNEPPTHQMARCRT